MRGVIVATLDGALVPSIGEPAERGLLALAALLTAVALTSVVRSADHESAGAMTAGQREDIELVHPARMVENWTAISETPTVRYVLARPSIAGTEGSGLQTRALTLSTRREVSRGRPRQRQFSRLVPGPR